MSNVEINSSDSEYLKCQRDFRYFILRYVKFVSFQDIRGIDCEKYVMDFLNHIDQPKLSITMKARQMGFTTISLAYVLWHAIFTSEARVFIASPCQAMAKEMLSRLKDMIDHSEFPFYIPEITKNNMSSLEFINGSVIRAVYTSSSATRGYSPTLVYIDEAGYVQQHHFQNFVECTLPVIMSMKNAKLLMVSSYNPSATLFNSFYTEGLAKGISKKFSWKDKHNYDEKWASNMKNVIGDSSFENEYELNNI